MVNAHIAYTFPLSMWIKHGRTRGVFALQRLREIVSELHLPLKHLDQGPLLNPRQTQGVDKWPLFRGSLWQPPGHPQQVTLKVVGARATVPCAGRFHAAWISAQPINNRRWLYYHHPRKFNG